MIDMISRAFIKNGFKTIRTHDIDNIVIDNNTTTFNYVHDHAAHQFWVVFNIDGLGFEVVPDK